MTEPILTAHNLSKTFAAPSGWLGSNQHAVKALDDVSIAIPRGKTLAIVGESGSGKSTLARCLLQLQTVDSGEVWFNRQNLAQLPAAALRAQRRHLQMVFQDPFASLNPRMTIGESVGEGLLVHKLGNAEQRRQKVVQMLQKVGLQEDDISKYPHQFSGGQRQRIGIARALILQPQLVVCDEPVSALDVSIQAQILLLLKQMQQEMQLSYLFITHDLRVVRHIADEVAVMRHGRIVEQGNVDAIFQHPQQEYTRELLSAIPGKKQH